jgi:hypothetical protein
VFFKRDSVTFRDITTLPVNLPEYRMTPQKQIANVTITLDTGLQTITADELTIEASVENLGNDTSLLTFAAVDELFPEEKFGRTIPDVIPEKFRVVVPTKRHEHLVAGTAAVDRDLITGELSYTSEQTNVFTLREISEFRDTTLLPVSLPEYRLTRDKQIANFVVTLDVGLQTITADELTVEANVDNLGNNTSLLTVGTVDELFTAESFGKTIPDVIPEKFRVVVPTSRHEYLVADKATVNRKLATVDWLHQRGINALPSGNQLWRDPTVAGQPAGTGSRLRNKSPMLP